MNILVVAATSMELRPLKIAIDQKMESVQLDFLNAGVGMVSTAYHLSRQICTKSYDLAINIGIAGSFGREIPLGTVVEVHSDRFSELGAEDDGQFIDLVQMKLQAENDFPFQRNLLLGDAPIPSTLRKVNGITVNKVHGKESSIEKIKDRLDPDVESMEGAAFLYVCKMEKLPCIQLRAISNYVEKRDTSNWRIADALQNLTAETYKYISLYA